MWCTHTNELRLRADCEHRMLRTHTEDTLTFACQTAKDDRCGWEHHLQYIYTRLTSDSSKVRFFHSLGSLQSLPTNTSRRGLDRTPPSPVGGRHHAHRRAVLQKKQRQFFMENDDLPRQARDQESSRNWSKRGVSRTPMRCAAVERKGQLQCPVRELLRLCGETILCFNFPYVCPEPVLEDDRVF